MNLINKEIKKIRVAKGMTQRQVANKIGVTPQYISNIESGRSVISARALRAFAKATRTPYTLLLGLLVKDYLRRFK